MPGPSINEHHLIPKSKKGKDTVTLHTICHSKEYRDRNRASRARQVSRRRRR
jgi:hypothetical protein